MSNLDAIYNEIRELRKDLDSMSPKLSIYKKTLERYNELKKLTGGQGMEVSGKPIKGYVKGHWK